MQADIDAEAARLDPRPQRGSQGAARRQRQQLHEGDHAHGEGRGDRQRADHVDRAASGAGAHKQVEDHPERGKQQNQSERKAFQDHSVTTASG